MFLAFGPPAFSDLIPTFLHDYYALARVAPKGQQEKMESNQNKTGKTRAGGHKPPPALFFLRRRTLMLSFIVALWARIERADPIKLSILLTLHASDLRKASLSCSLALKSRSAYRTSVFI